MKILVICQYYYPEPFRISDICEELVKIGHEVTVITGIPNYPMGIIYPEYKNGQKRDEIINGVKVHRCFTIGRRNGVVWRLLNYYSFSISSSIYTSRMKEDFDVIFVNQLSPVMMANAGIKYKKKRNKKMILYCLDLWPDSLIAGGIKKDSFIYKLFLYTSKNIYRQADKILITSRMFKEYLIHEFDIVKNKIEYLPQYAEDLFTILPKQQIQDKETIDLVFAGNIGVAQSIPTIIKAAKELKHIENLRWHIIGDGSELTNCKVLTQELGLKSIIFYGQKAIEEMPKYYSMADAMLVTIINDSVLSLTLPGKVQSYLAAGKPIIGAANGETKRVISDARCGYCCDAEDYMGLASILLNFIQLKDVKNFGFNAKEYYYKNFSKTQFIENLIIELIHI
ncbi:MAG: glycosyltransferase family 4 protein [Eubacteriales bacterium]